jgi:hypothetical protein
MPRLEVPPLLALGDTVFRITTPAQKSGNVCTQYASYVR